MNIEFYVIIADGTWDQIAEGRSNAKRECRDLEKMGCTVRMIGPVSAVKADEMEDVYANGGTFGDLRRIAERLS